VRRFLGLSHDDRWVLTRAFVGLGVVEVALRVLGFQRTMRLIDRRRPGTAALPPAAGVEPNAEQLQRARRYAAWVATAARHHVVRARCLHRSLLLHHWLRCEGLPSRLRIGVRKIDGALNAHAWVELGGRVVNDRAVAVALFVPLAGAGGAHLGRDVWPAYDGPVARERPGA
jgi:hypothetical protein